MISLFIGLGGVGTKALDFLYHKIDFYNKDLAMQGKPQVDAYYYYVDTEPNADGKYPCNVSEALRKIAEERN